MSKYVVAFRVERRSVAAAVFAGTKLDYAEAKQLAGKHDKAEATVIGFANWIVSNFDIESAVIETFEDGSEILRARLHNAMERVLASSGAAVRKIDKSYLLEAFGHPPLTNRKNVREVVTVIWPMLGLKTHAGAKLDAIALGLYLQTERLFQN